MFDRLLGLETEYAIRFVPRDGERPTNAAIYDAFADVVGSLVATRPGGRTKRERFLENGGILSYESQPQALDGGLIEAGTPECRGPSEAVLYQRAQEDLLVRAIPLVGRRLDGELTLLKNCRDAEGHTYGAQENYEAELARGAWLGVWRAGLVALVPPTIVAGLLTWAVVITMVPVVLGLMLVLALAGFVPGLRWLHDALSPQGRLLNVLLRPLVWIERAIWEPVTIPFLLLYRLCAFRELRRGLLPFLISRPIVTGAGTLVDDTFALSEKAVAARRICRSSLARGVSIFEPGNLVKGLHALPRLDFARFAALFRRRQRLQIGLSDSNMAQTAEYLKVATTCLVLDLIEAGAVAPPPIDAPLPTLRRINAVDHATALALQRTYLEAARRYTRDAAATPLEVTELIARWSAVLDAIEQAPDTLVGQLDWITKRTLIDRAGSTPDERKKIDLKYHELGTGYFARLEGRGLASTLVTPDEARTASAEAPATTPARNRARLIRDLAGVAKVTVGWGSVRIGGPLRGKVIRLDDYRRDDD